MLLDEAEPHLGRFEIGREVLADQTTIPVLDPGRGRTKKGYAPRRSRATTGPGAGGTRPLSCSATPRAARPSTERI
jgi:hypothetical protein